MGGAADSFPVGDRFPGVGQGPPWKLKAGKRPAAPLCNPGGWGRNTLLEKYQYLRSSCLVNSLYILEQNYLLNLNKLFVRIRPSK